MSKKNITEAGTLILTGDTYEIRDVLRRNSWTYDPPSRSWRKPAKAGDAIAIRPRCQCVLRTAASDVAVYGVPAAAVVSTPSGALIRSEYTQAQRSAMQRDGIDTDCDDHDLI